MTNQKQKITDIIDITQEELDKIKKELKPNEKKDLYMDKDIRITLFKIGKKVYEVICEYGDKPFTEVFKDMLAVVGNNV